MSERNVLSRVRVRKSLSISGVSGVLPVARVAIRSVRSAGSVSFKLSKNAARKSKSETSLRIGSTSFSASPARCDVIAVSTTAPTSAPRRPPATTGVFDTLTAASTSSWAMVAWTRVEVMVDACTGLSGM